MLTTLLPEDVHVTWRENALVITGVHAEDWTNAQRAETARRILADLEATLPGMFVAVSVSSFATAQVASQDSAPARRDGAVGHGAATTYKPAAVTA